MGNFLLERALRLFLSHSDYLSSGLGPQLTPLVHTHWQGPANAFLAPVSTIQTFNLIFFFSFTSSSILAVLCLYPTFILYSSLPYSGPQEAALHGMHPTSSLISWLRTANGEAPGRALWAGRENVGGTFAILWDDSSLQANCPGPDKV